MKLNWKRSRFGVGILTLLLLMAPAVRAQVATATLSGTVTDPSGAVLPNVKVTIENLATGQSTVTYTDADGIFRADNLSRGDYRVSFSVDGLGVRTIEITLAAGAQETRNIVMDQQLLPGSAQEQQKLPNAPSSTPSKPSLSDLGFPPAEIRGSAQDQAKLDRRTHMLTIHQRLGLVTAGALAATVITGSFVGEDSTSPSTRDLHAALGSATAGLYFTTAYFAIRAPKISGTKTRGSIRLHKTLAWIHGPGMILTPVLGALAFEQRRRGQEVHGIASAHAPVAYVTALAYGAAILSVSLKF
jgi:Carboxypeptidase regulatory-like domain